MKKMDEIHALREKIDECDEKILKLLNERSEVVMKIAEIKRNENLDFYFPEREREILEKLQKINRGRFPNDALKNIFREIFCASLSLEQPLTVTYLGPEATYTHFAALRYFGSSCKFVPANSIREVFESVSLGNTGFGLVPIENSNEGVITYTLDMFIDYDLKIYGEVPLEISHNLISSSQDKFSIKKIYSHPQAAAQCRVWLERNMFGIPIFNSSSTAQAASLATQEEDAAAIASELAAKLYDLNFIERHIEDNKKNITRFLVISKKSHQRSGDDKTSIMFSVKDEPGSLYDILTPLKRSRINLTKIVSRPSKKKAWDYIFFVDLEGHMEDKKVKRALAAVEKHSLYMNVLGSYPKADREEE